MTDQERQLRQALAEELSRRYPWGSVWDSLVGPFGDGVSATEYLYAYRIRDRNEGRHVRP